MAVVSNSGDRRRLARTVTCSTPRDAPAYASMTSRFGYLPSPNPSCNEPSRATAIAQTFSVQARSLDLACNAVRANMAHIERQVLEAGIREGREAIATAMNNGRQRVLAPA